MPDGQHNASRSGFETRNGSAMWGPGHSRVHRFRKAGRHASRESARQSVGRDQFV